MVRGRAFSQGKPWQLPPVGARPAARIPLNSNLMQIARWGGLLQVASSNVGQFKTQLFC